MNVKQTIQLHIKSVTNLHNKQNVGSYIIIDKSEDKSVMVQNSVECESKEQRDTQKICSKTDISGDYESTSDDD